MAAAGGAFKRWMLDGCSVGTKRTGPPMTPGWARHWLLYSPDSSPRPMEGVAMTVRPDGAKAARPQKTHQLLCTASSIFFSTWSMLKLAGFMRGGNAWKVARNSRTMNWAA